MSAEEHLGQGTPRVMQIGIREVQFGRNVIVVEPVNLYECAIGTNATILPVRIADHVLIGAGAVVTRDIDEPGIYAGNPARRIRTLPKRL